MDCTGLCKNFTIEDCTELQQDCLDWMRIVTDSWPCNRHLNPTNPITIDKILTKSNFLINVNVVRFRDFSGSVYAHFPNVAEIDNDKLLQLKPGPIFHLCNNQTF